MDPETRSEMLELLILNAAKRGGWRIPRLADLETEVLEAGVDASLEEIRDKLLEVAGRPNNNLDLRRYDGWLELVDVTTARAA